MPTDNVHVLHTARPVNATAVERLERALEDAKSGELVAVAIAGVAFNGAARTAFSTAENGVTLSGAIEVLRARALEGLLSAQD